jgi:hypothetical protein
MRLTLFWLATGVLGVLVAVGTLLLVASTRRVLLLLRDRLPVEWQALGSPNHLWDVVWRDDERRFKQFVSTKRYRSLPDRDVAEAFEGYVRNRDRYLVVLLASSVAVILVRWAGC